MLFLHMRMKKKNCEICENYDESVKWNESLFETEIYVDLKYEIRNSTWNCTENGRLMRSFSESRHIFFYMSGTNVYCDNRRL